MKTMFYQSDLPKKTKAAPNVIFECVPGVDWRYPLDDMSRHAVRHMVRYFDICSWWTLSEVLDDLTPAAERLQLVFHFLDVAFECHRIGGGNQHGPCTCSSSPAAT